jgi:uncharacterized protein YyaL (SSP411 family)
VANRLANATSPYLLQHQDNPVDWQEWGEAAFREARERDVPILLSVGYAACHWCHVMAHESFEDDEVAAALNAGFVSVKVDREERPDIDAVYMAATSALTGHGGWPMTCFLTPEAEPFYCGTYFPKGQFLQLLTAITEAWHSQRAQVNASGSHIASQLRDIAVPPPPVAISDDVLAASVTSLASQFDRVRGGFGSAPKFPPSMVLEFLLRHHGRTGSRPALEMAQRTCEAMARGGIYDQLAGGFARYAVDAAWVVPHFEKMLYDNAQLLRVYAHLFRSTGSRIARRVAVETADFLLRDLRTAEGAFASALDADTDGVEGLTYVWTPAQLAEVLGEEDARQAAALLEVTSAGTFEYGTSTLQLLRDPPEPDWWQATRERLLTARQSRPQPARDDKVVTSWNGLAIAGLSDAGAILGGRAGRTLIAAAEQCAEHLLALHWSGGRLLRTSRQGRPGTAHGVADDYGNLGDALLALHQADGEPRWLQAAGEVLESALARFGADDGGFHDTADDAEALVSRPRSLSDNAEPSGQSSLAGALLTYAALTGSSRHRAAAEGALSVMGPVASREPRFGGWALAVAEAAAAGPLEVAIVGPSPEDTAPFLEVARACPSPGLVIAHGAPDQAGVPLLDARPLVKGAPAAYVCRGFVCEAPVTSPEALAAALRG